MIQIGFDAQAMNAGLERLAKKHGLEVRDLLHDQMRLWCQDVIRILPPKNKRQGQQAIRKDMRKIFVSRGQRYLDFMERAFGKRLWNKAGSAAVHFDFFANDANMRTMEDFHLMSRDKRGRTRRPKGPRKVRVGKDELPYKMHVPISQLRQYEKRLQARVGKLKAGFLPAAEYYAKLAKAKARVNVFVREAGSANLQLGSHAGRLDSNGSGRIESVNNVPYVGRHAAKSLFKRAQSRREKDLMVGVEKRMYGKNGLVARFNKGKA